MIGNIEYHKELAINLADHLISLGAKEMMA